jgi:hypothetical protein
MRELGLAARPKRKRRSATRPGRGRWRAPDLVKRDFRAARVNQKWFGDGTGLVTGEGKLYLASVLDAASRRVLGFGLGEHHDAQLAYGAPTAKLGGGEHGVSGDGPAPRRAGVPYPWGCRGQMSSARQSGGPASRHEDRTVGWRLSQAAGMRRLPYGGMLPRRCQRWLMSG